MVTLYELRDKIGATTIQSVKIRIRNWLVLYITELLTRFSYCQLERRLAKHGLHLTKGAISLIHHRKWFPQKESRIIGIYEAFKEMKEAENKDV